MPRFVLLRHEWPDGSSRRSHWDWMFECGDSLATWALDPLPIAGGDEVPAERLADHRTAYLDYEGPVSGDRGSVTRIDRGEYSAVEPASPDQWRLKLRGETFRGVITFRRVDETSNAWKCRFEPE